MIAHRSVNLIPILKSFQTSYSYTLLIKGVSEKFYAIASVVCLIDMTKS